MAITGVRGEQIRDGEIETVDIADGAVTNAKIAAGTIQADRLAFDHGGLPGLLDDDHTQYVRLGGRAGGQTLYGGTGVGDDLTLETTSNATKGTINIAIGGGNVVIGNASAAPKLLTVYKDVEIRSDVSTPLLQLYNEAASSSDGARDTEIIWRGEAVTAGAHDAAKILVEHDGAADDTKARMTFHVNDGAGLKEFMRLDSNSRLEIIDPDASATGLDYFLTQGNDGTAWITSDNGGAFTGLAMNQTTQKIEFYRNSGLSAELTADLRILGGGVQVANTTNALAGMLRWSTGNALEVSNGTTWYEIWHAGNDGAGSGLDADMVDGIQASSLLRTDGSLPLTADWDAGDFGITAQFLTVEDSSLAILNIRETTNTDGDGLRDAILRFQGHTSTGTLFDQGQIRMEHDGAGADKKSRMIFSVNQDSASVTEIMRISADGNLGLGTTTPGGNSTKGTNVFSIGNGTAPAGGVTGQISLYSSSGELYVLDQSGNATLLSPHDTETGEWIFYSRNTKTGAVLRVEMERLIAEVERMSGKKFSFRSTN
ncbi:MAG: hypothetical protein D6800_01695 [Candidatus Zixiibacteriota bacterium]|nr:MAG: hypothetical protein D6800_01695 [candidate division Zixibacteria bacterium]